MSILINKYSSLVKKKCNEVKLDYFPQAEASDLLYKVITLEDIYLPLSLREASSYNIPDSFEDMRNVDTDELIRIIDEKIKALEIKINELENFSLNKPLYIQDIDSSNNSALNTEEVANNSLGLRLLIQGNPGSGKTTFCKRLMLAILKNEKVFFDKYVKENGLVFNRKALPLLISCRGITELTMDELISSSFEETLYKLCLFNFGKDFSNISKTEFINIIKQSTSKQLLIIFDGWDEILDSDKVDYFKTQINTFIEMYPKVDLIITIRASYLEPILEQPYSGRYKICGLTEDEVRTFCKNWWSVILSSSQQRGNNIVLAEQILQSKDSQIKEMRTNPLDLSLLLTVSKNDGCLPENKAELFQKLVDLYIYWSINKNTGDLSARSIKILLAYIASSMTKKHLLIYRYDELVEIIKQAIIDLKWSFKDDISLIDTSNIIKELEHTGILKRTYSGERFSFSESSFAGHHRQMQEYLTAYAISAQYSDEEYNNMSPIEILEDKYDLNYWNEVIVFIVLMSPAWLCKTITNKLIEKAETKNGDTFVYSDLLFDFVVNGADIRDEKYKIYDICFFEHITERQIENINILVSATNKNSADFINYIHTKYNESLEKDDIKYQYANAIIEASVDVKQGLSPLFRAEVLTKSNNKNDIITGTQILTIMAWCKYARIRNVFSDYYSNYHMTREWIFLYKRLIKDIRYATYIMGSIREAILAEYISFKDFFDDDDINQICLNFDINRTVIKKVESIYILLSCVPVFDNLQLYTVSVSKVIRDVFLEYFRDDIENNNYDDIIFSFCVCAATGCWDEQELKKEWITVDKIYNKSNNIGSMAEARYRQLKATLKNREYTYLYQLLYNICLPPFFSDLDEEYSSMKWQLSKKLKSQITYVCDLGELKIEFPINGLSDDAQKFLKKILFNSFGTYNNLAYLLRRKELTNITINSTSVTILTPEQLLKKGVLAIDYFSIINYSLTISGIYSNNMGEYKIGKEFLLGIRDLFSLDFSFWKEVVFWWLKLAVSQREYEGIVVLTWLYAIGVIELSDYVVEKQIELISVINSLNSEVEDIVLFKNSLQNTANIKQSRISTTHSSV